MGELHTAWMQYAEAELNQWAQAQDEDGNQYFYNVNNMETTWDNPQEVVLPAWRAKLMAIGMLVDESCVAKFSSATSESSAPSQSQPSKSHAKKQSQDSPSEGQPSQV